jgi:hypothetical protein
MDFETAVHVSQEVERIFPDLIVSGFRRLSPDRVNAWAIDIIDPDSGNMATVDEKDNCDRVMEVNFPERKKNAI